MAHYAFIDLKNTVRHTIVGRDETDFVEGVDSWESYYGDRKGMTCKRTSYNTHGGIHYTDGEPSEDQTEAFRFNYAGIGFTYDEARDAFIPPTPYASWVLDEDSCLWVAPIDYPADGDHVWDEQAGDWLEVTDENS